MSKRTPVIVDTSIWSGVLRRKTDVVHGAVIKELIAAGRLVMLGPQPRK
jgi:hypothetical protein